MTAEPAQDRPDNLFESVPDDYAAQGRFGDRASAVSPAIWSSEHRDLLLALGALALTGLAGMLLAGYARRSPRRCHPTNAPS